jgi:hypothetical protein
VRNVVNNRVDVNAIITKEYVVIILVFIVFNILLLKKCKANTHGFSHSLLGVLWPYTKAQYMSRIRSER